MTGIGIPNSLKTNCLWVRVPLSLPMENVIRNVERKLKHIPNYSLYVREAASLAMLKGVTEQDPYSYSYVTTIAKRLAVKDCKKRMENLEFEPYKPQPIDTTQELLDAIAKILKPHHMKFLMNGIVNGWKHKNSADKVRCRRIRIKIAKHILTKPEFDGPLVRRIVKRWGSIAL